MRKVISYCIFRMPDMESWLFYTYLRGLVWNVKMNKLVFPDWETHIEIDVKVFSDYDNIFYGLKEMYGVYFNINEQMPLCKGMLTRLKPIFDEEVEFVSCRDSDALTSYREAFIIQKWLKEIKSGIFTIRDNYAHSLPIMGGLTSYRADIIRNLYGTWDNWLEQANDLTKHGSDQKFLMDTVYKVFSSTVFNAKELGMYFTANEMLPNVNTDLWVSNLCSFFIGSAGVNDMETIRFMKRYASNTEFEEIEKRYPQIFYWHMK